MAEISTSMTHSRFETEASIVEPMLGLALRIDPIVTAELATSVDDDSPHLSAQPAPMYATCMDSKLENATLRLLEALSQPTEARLLGPSILREITHHVLMGEQGGSLRAAVSDFLGLPCGHCLIFWSIAFPHPRGMALAW